jgi:hypothetical protein
MPSRRPAAVPIDDHPHVAALRALKATSWGLADLRRHGAHAVGIGRKIVAGRPTAAPSLRIYVEKKRARPRGVAVVPPFVRAPHPVTGEVLDIPTDVVECAPTRHHALDPTQMIRPVPGGVSCGIRIVPGREGATGTLGGWVWDRQHNDVVMLSNDHVLGHRRGTHITQPGDADSIGRAPRRIGTVRRGIDRNTGKPVKCDCAIGVVERPDLADLSVHDIGPAVMAIADPALGLRVEKYGRSTRHSSGEVDDIDWRGIVQSEVPGDPEHLYDDCIRIVARRPSKVWAAAGDSGSLVFASEELSDGSGIKPVIALHFGGEGNFGMACRISRVFDALDLATLTDGLLMLLANAVDETRQPSDSTERELVRTVAMESGHRKAHRAAVHSGNRRKPANELLAEFVQRLGASGGTSRVARTLTRNRAELTNLLLHRVPLCELAARAVRSLASGAANVDDVLATRLTYRTIKSWDSLLRELIEVGSPTLRRALAPLRELIARSSGSSVASALGIHHGDTPSGAPEAVHRARV